VGAEHLPPARNIEVKRPEMSESLLEASQIVELLRFLAANEPSGTTLVNIRETSEGVIADFDGPGKSGRISCWLRGLFDLEILTDVDGKQVYFRHEEVARIETQSLKDAVSEFLTVLGSDA
jgi:hypothetical protein